MALVFHNIVSSSSSSDTALRICPPSLWSDWFSARYRDVMSRCSVDPRIPRGPLEISLVYTPGELWWRIDPSSDLYDGSSSSFWVTDLSDLSDGSSPVNYMLSLVPYNSDCDTYIVSAS